MSESLLLIKAEEISNAIEDLKKNPPPFIGDRKFKGFLICPSIDVYRRPVAYLNAVYGTGESNTWNKLESSDGDVIIQNTKLVACPYPPGYGS